MFTLIQLESFIAVAEELHFGAAAERLNMTQPPLSRQIQLLEKELHAQLFDRTSRRVELTAAGRTLLPSARQILDLSIKTQLDVQRVATGDAGAVTIGYTAIAGQSALPRLLRRSANEQPGVSLLLRELVSTDQMDGLVKGTVDIGLLRPIVARPGIKYRPVMQDRLVIALPAESPLLEEGESLPLQALSGEPLMMYSTSEARYFHDLVLRLFASAGAEPRITQYASQVPALLAFVEAGLGVTLVPASTRAFSPPGVRFREIEGSRGTQALNRVDLEVAWNENNTNPAVLKLLSLLDGNLDDPSSNDSA
ncbi:LysR family transcriptional regulator [Arthrobacter crystallopoietes]|uniref:LysR family transcriptional regulator n=1 Tax=Crystallibacter crystallopoietes TaxID=37928 RepID=UPI001ABE9544|nr:LysR family transcriptional regulator [Arthrobacter crystallopoietes]QTG81231.1 LysR family transcriptional regulator [Arthrobacter crystallopoietes]